MLTAKQISSCAEFTTRHDATGDRARAFTAAIIGTLEAEVHLKGMTLGLLRRTEYLSVLGALYSVFPHLRDDALLQALTSSHCECAQ